MFATNITGSYVNSTEQANLIQEYKRTFDTFSRPVVIWKAPLEVTLIENSTNPGLIGFGDGQVAQQITYIPVSGIYNCVIRYVNTKRNIQAIETINETNTVTAIGEVMLKFEVDAYNFIENSGQTDKFTFDNRDWYFASKARAMPFLGALYYQYQVKPKP